MYNGNCIDYKIDGYGKMIYTMEMNNKRLEK